MMLERIKRYDWYDWALFTLTVAVIISVVAVVVSITSTRTEPWNGITYVIPAQVITPDNQIPESFGRGDEVPVRITRVTDCVNFSCPKDGLATLVTVRFQLLEDGVEQTTVITVLEEFEQVLIEGEAYIPGENLISTINLNPIPVPPEVIGHAAVNGGSSTWRIEGTVTPLVDNASPVPWGTATFVVRP